MNKSILLIILISFAFLGCKDETVGPDPPEQEIKTLIPLATGNYWLYNSYYLENTGEPIGKALKYICGFAIGDTVLREIGGKTITTYKFCNCFENKIPRDYNRHNQFEGAKLVYQNKNGMYHAGFMHGDTLLSTYNDLIFSFPATKGQNLKGHMFHYDPLGNYISMPDSVITDFTCVSTDSLVQIPLGKFNCIVYKMWYFHFPQYNRSDVYFYISPGIGIIKMELKKYFYQQNLTTYFKKFELKEYYINNEMK